MIDKVDLSKTYLYTFIGRPPYQKIKVERSNASDNSEYPYSIINALDKSFITRASNEWILTALSPIPENNCKCSHTRLSL